MIKAIETQYKGYRFRSRLEARWAVFFDAIGIEWEYEPEGLDINGIKYLPDFRLTKSKQFIEIKPTQTGTLWEPVKVYLAGKIMDGKNYREFLANRKEIADDWFFRRFYTGINGIPILYIGPFTSACRTHELSSNAQHGIDEGHNGIDKSLTKRECMNAIKSCDIFYAHISSMNCFATFEEIGYARGLNKTVIISYDHSLKARIRNDMWFSNLDVWGKGDCQVIEQKDWTSYLASRIGNKWIMEAGVLYKAACALAADLDIIVLLGDPYEHCTWPAMGQSVLYGLEPNVTKPAAEKARSARFEFGESG